MKTFWRLIQYVREYRLRLIIACLCSAGVAILMAVNAWLVEPVLDKIFIEKNEFLLLILPAVLLVVTVLRGVFSYGQAYLMSYVGNWIVADVRQQLFMQLMRLPVRFHDANSSGRLVSRVIHDVNQMANAIPSILKDLFQQSLTFVALLGVAFYQNSKLASILLLVVPLSALVSKQRETIAQCKSNGTYEGFHGEYPTTI